MVAILVVCRIPLWRAEQPTTGRNSPGDPADKSLAMHSSRAVIPEPREPFFAWMIGNSAGAHLGHRTRISQTVKSVCQPGSGCHAGFRNAMRRTLGLCTVTQLEECRTHASIECIYSTLLNMSRSPSCSSDCQSPRAETAPH